MKCIKCESILEDVRLYWPCPTCTRLYDADGDGGLYLQLLGAISICSGGDKWDSTYFIVTEGGAEHLFVGADREEAIRLYQEKFPAEEVASCIKLTAVLRSLLAHDLQEAERIIVLYWGKDNWGIEE